MDESDKGEGIKKAPKAVAQVAMMVLPYGVIPSSGELKLGTVTGQNPDHGDIASEITSEVIDDEITDEIFEKKRPAPIPVRASDYHKAIIKDKAKAAGMAISRYMLAAALGSDYKPPTDPELTKALLRLNRELTAQGNNLNQIAHHLNSGRSSPAEGSSLLAIMGRSMLQTHKAIRNALSWGKTPEP